MSQTIVRAASEMITAAGVIAASFHDKGVSVAKKGEIDLVTKADHAVEAHIINWITSHYPTHGILAEESGAHPGENPYRWVIDPIDGTTNFAHQLGHFCILVGFQESGEGGNYETLFGLTLDPLRREFFVAERGQGATLNGRPIAVSTTTDLHQSLLCTGFGYNRLFEAQDNHREFCRLNHLTRGVRRFGSAGLDLAWVACGRYDGFWEHNLNPWDLTPGFILVDEAGGCVTDYQGRSPRPESGEVVCANPAFHPTLMAALDSARKEPINSRRGMDPFLTRASQQRLAETTSQP